MTGQSKTAVGQGTLVATGGGTTTLSRGHAPNRRKALKHANAMIEAIRKAHRAGKHRRADELTHMYLNSWDARLSVVLEACTQLKPHARPKATLIPGYAEALNPWAGTAEEVILRVKTKHGNPDNYRAILDFGIENRALQCLVAKVLRARADLHPHQYGMRGTHQAIARVESLLAAGYAWAVGADLEDGYPSFNEDKVCDLLPLPQRVVQNVLLGKSLTVRLGYPNIFGPPDDVADEAAFTEALLEEARQGFLQGSAASPIAIEMLLAPVFHQLPACGEVTADGDKFLIMAKNANDAVSARSAMRDALLAHPVGPLRPKLIQTFRPHEPIEFLEHRFQRTNGGLQIDPSPASLARFRQTLREGIREIDRLKSDTKNVDRGRRHIRELGRYVKGWTASFKMCTGIDDLRAKALLDIELAAPAAWLP